MALDPRYVLSKDLEPLLVDKDTGAPLSGGLVYFYKDLARNTLKPIFELTGAPPNYTYTQLPNPIVLSALGTLQNNNGDNVALYYYPWSSTAVDAVLEQYFVDVFNSNGVPQFSREAWPNYFGEQGGGGGAGSNVYLPNLIANPQFIFISFPAGVPLVISSPGAGTVVTAIAPAWSLSVTFSAAGSLTVAQTPIAGSSQFPTNPPFTLDIVPGLNVVDVSLIQKLDHTPDIWSPATGGANGFIATNITLGNNTTATITYAPSQVTAGNPQTLLTTTNISGSYKQFSNTIQLLPAANTDTGTTGFVNIVVNLSPVNPSSVTSIQVVGIDTNIVDVPYQQTPYRFQQAEVVIDIVNNGRLLGFQIFTAGVGATYTKTAGTVAILVECVGGGGGGGGMVTTIGNSGAGGGGGSGGYSRLYIPAAANTYLYTVGAAGAAGAAGYNPGGDGTATTFSTISAGGGTGGGGAIGSNLISFTSGAGLAGVATGGDVNVNGQGGTPGFQLTGGSIGGSGGQSYFGGAATGVTSGISVPGSDASANSGSGGSGATGNNLNISQPGGAGGAGLIIVWEFS